MNYIKVILICIGTGFLIPVQAQDEKEVWYTWIDARVTIEGQSVRVVSNELMEITCCVNSAKYRKFSSKTVKWLDKSLEAEINADSPFAKTKDKELADKILKDILSEAENNSSIRIIDYNESCR